MVKNLLATLLLALCVHINVCFAVSRPQEIQYALTDNPIDVVIVSHPKDKVTLNFCIEGIRKNCAKIGRVIVVSSEKLSDEAEWFDEANFPFSKQDIAMEIGRGNEAIMKKFFEHHQRSGWYYQQLLKLYSAFCIPDISNNILVVDADTIFLNPVEFLNDSFGGLFCIGHSKTRQNYLDHAKRLLPKYTRGLSPHYSICHHMLFQKPILEKLFEEVAQKHQVPFWQAFCQCIDLKEGGASEYEIYSDFALSTTNQVGLRPLKWRNDSKFVKRNEFQKKGYHFVSFHTYLRKPMQ